MDSKIETQPSPSLPPFSIFLLGTATLFTPELKQSPKPMPYKKGAKVKDYPKGETLSVIASLINTKAPVKTTKVDVKNPYPYQADELTVINGPNTKGTDVGEKIAHGLAAILKAIARNQTRINILAHSRGAVQSILIAHELEFLQKAITTCTTFDEVLKLLSEQQAKRLKGPPKNNTPDIVEPLKTQINLIPQEEQEQWFKALKTNLPQATINFLGIDPVPGDFFPITWYDERFFTLPQIIKNTELLYYANERSDSGFTPICPEVASKEEQNFVRYSMPGHHGTGSSGNNGSQRNIIVCSDGFKTTHVQKLILYKGLNFLHGHGVAFNDGAQIFHPHTALGRKYAGSNTESQTIDIPKLDFTTIYRTIYTAIAKNQKGGYDEYDNTNYFFMGLSKRRKILRTGHLYGVFSDVFSTYSGYVNEEHAQLMQAHFFKLFGLDTQTNNLVELVNIARTILIENINKMASKEVSILDSEDARKNILETYSIVILKVSQHYLTNDWSPIEKQKEKQDLFQAIADILAKFKELSITDNSVIQQFVLELNQLSFSSINHTIISQYLDLQKDFNYLQEPINNRLIHFFSALLMQLNQSENNPTLALNEIINSTEYKVLPNHPPEIKISHIYKQLTEKGLEDYTIEQLTMSYEEQFADSIDDFVKLYQQLQLLINDISALRNIVTSQIIEVDEQDLHQQSKALIITAAERFYRDRPQALPPIDEENLFLNLAEQHAIIHLGLPDRSKAASSNIITSTLYSFWQPVANIIYGSGTPAKSINTDSNNKETSLTK